MDGLGFTDRSFCCFRRARRSEKAGKAVAKELGNSNKPKKNTKRSKYYMNQSPTQAVYAEPLTPTPAVFCPPSAPRPTTRSPPTQSPVMIPTGLAPPQPKPAVTTLRSMPVNQYPQHHSQQQCITLLPGLISFQPGSMNTLSYALNGTLQRGGLNGDQHRINIGLVARNVT